MLVLIPPFFNNGGHSLCNDRTDMEKEKDIFRLANIIARSLEGTLSVEEQQELDDWLTASDINRKRVRNICKWIGRQIVKCLWLLGQGCKGVGECNDFHGTRLCLCWYLGLR